MGAYLSIIIPGTGSSQSKKKKKKIAKEAAPEGITGYFKENSSETYSYCGQWSNSNRQ